jgi:hypothetical protein
MNNKLSNKLLEKIKQQAKLEEYWHRPSPYIQPKITNVNDDDMTVEKYINTVASHEFIEGGRQVPNRKPKY